MKKLIVASVNASHIFEINTNSDGRTILTGYEGRFLQAILDFMGLEYELVIPSDRQWGSLKEDGNWSGLIGMVQRGEADMAFNMLGMSQSRREVVDFSSAYAIDGSSFPIQKVPSPPSALTLLNPFDIPTWILFIVSLVLTAVVLNVIAFRGRGSWGHLCLVLLASVLRQTMDVGKNSKKVSLLLSFWSFLALMISFGYSAVLLAILTVPLQETPIKNFQELAEAIRKGTRGCAIVNGTSLLPYFVNSKEKHLKYIGQEIERNKWFISSKAEELRYIRKKYIVIKSTIIATTISGDSVLHRTRRSENIDISPLGIALGSNFCCKRRLGMLLSRMQSSGLHGKYMRDQRLIKWLSSPGKTSDPKGERPLNLGDLSGAFAVLLVGYVLSIFAFLREVVHSKRKKKVRNASEN